MAIGGALCVGDVSSGNGGIVSAIMGDRAETDVQVRWFASLAAAAVAGGGG
jgi:hypothetical protein